VHTQSGPPRAAKERKVLAMHDLKIADPLRCPRELLQLLFENSLSEEALLLSARIDTAQLQAWQQELAAVSGL